MNNLEVADAGSAPSQDVEMFQGEMAQEAPQIENVPTSDIDPVSGQEVAAPINETTENGVNPKEDTNRYEYWQSQADKAKSELSNLREELDYYRNPAAYQKVLTPVSNQQHMSQHTPVQGYLPCPVAPTASPMASSSTHVASADLPPNPFFY